MEPYYDQYLPLSVATNRLVNEDGDGMDEKSPRLPGLKLERLKWLSKGLQQNEKAGPRVRWMLLGACIALMSVAIVLSAINRDKINIALSSTKIWEDCGGSPEEAKRRGCTFELLTFGWQTKECHNAELAEEFAALGWVWWSDANATAEVPEDIVSRGDTNYWVLQRYHVMHCAYTLQMMHQGWERGYIEHDIIETGHTRHCAELMTDEALPWDVVGTQAHVYYPRCIRVK